MTMSLPFFESGLPVLDALAKPGMLCAFDFDGTIAPIVKEPARAFAPTAVSRRLARLCDYASVAIITGRSVADMPTRLDFKPHFIVGNHGLEGVPGWGNDNQRQRHLCQDWLATLSAALSNRTMFDPGIQIEDKGLSLSVHYRMAHDRTQAHTQLSRLFETLTPPADIIAGKCVFNLLPPNSINKGSAMIRLMEISGAGSALYVGDDITDEHVFRLHRPDLLSVRIERASDSAAPFFLHHRLDMTALLDELIKRLHKEIAYRAS
jgi:trehalose 6-phosphate phosphatase